MHYTTWGSLHKSLMSYICLPKFAFASEIKNGSLFSIQLLYVNLISLEDAKKALFFLVFTYTGGVTIVSLHAISNRKYVNPLKKWEFNHVFFMSVLYVSALFSSCKPHKFWIASYTAIFFFAEYTVYRKFKGNAICRHCTLLCLRHTSSANSMTHLKKKMD